MRFLQAPFAAAFDAGSNAVIMAGRLLSFIPDVETLAPVTSSLMQKPLLC
jgi:hypothetical protein